MKRFDFWGQFGYNNIINKIPMGPVRRSSEQTYCQRFSFTLKLELLAN